MLISVINIYIYIYKIILSTVSNYTAKQLTAADLVKYNDDH